MSDPVTNVEIEDVLSSIRRLVTESGSKNAEQDTPAADAQTAVESDVGDAGDAMEKLVLTPSLRIAAPADEANEILSDEPEASVEDAVEQAMEGACEVSDEPADEVADESLVSRIEQLETAVADKVDDWEDDTEGEGDNAAAPFETLQWEDHVDAPNDDEEYDDAAMFVAPQPAPEEETLAKDELVQEADPTQEDESEEAEFAAVTDADDTEGDEGFELSSEDAVIDEDMLREMVSDIVRQELQGALGERITRNVRKLVRREIHRALMAQELE